MKKILSKIDRERIITIGQSKCPIGHLARLKRVQHFDFMHQSCLVKHGCGQSGYFQVVGQKDEIPAVFRIVI
jgi:hypothetical protein